MRTVIGFIGTSAIYWTPESGAVYVGAQYAGSADTPGRALALAREQTDVTIHALQRRYVGVAL